MKKKNYYPIEKIINIAKKGGMYILVDDENRENEGDLVFAHQINSQKYKFHGKIWKRLNLFDIK